MLRTTIKKKAKASAPSRVVFFLCLKVVGFPSRYVNWVRECITTPKYSVAGYFKGVKEMRQRDLLSPHLFLLAMEFLNPTQMLKEKESSLQGLQLPS